MPPPFAIEPALESDLPAIQAIYAWAAKATTASFAVEPEPLEEWQRWFRETSPFHTWRVARSAEGVLGFARSLPHRPRDAYRWTAEVSIYIDPRHHGLGVGTALYADLIGILRAQGFVTLLAGVTGGNLASEKLHTRAGFTLCGVFPRVGWKMGRWNDVGWYALQLDPGGEPRPLRTVAEVLR